jgi:arylsulfatase A-like enzyme
VKARPATLSPKPNLLVFLPDQLRVDTVFGEKANAVHAPNIHTLASQSTIFERAYVTQPVCAPSRSSLLSGTWPHRNGCLTNGGVLPRKYLCLPEMLADPSYTSGYFGKWHLGDEFIPQRGFSEWASILETFKRVDRESHFRRRIEQLLSAFEPSRRLEHKRTAKRTSDYAEFLRSKGYQPDLHKHQQFSELLPTTVPFQFSKAKFVESKACEFLDRHGRAPFLMFVAFYEPHPPYNGPFNCEHPFETILLDGTAEETFGEEVPLRQRLMQEAYRNRLGGVDGYRQVKQNYFGLITEIDHCIGTILGKIEDLGVADRTIIVLTSDHGDMMSAHGLLGKYVMYEKSAAVPYLIRAPGINPRRLSQPVSHIDFVPTMLDLLGKPPHAQCAGRSKANVIRGESEPSELVFFQWSPAGSGIPIKRSAFAKGEEIKSCLRQSIRTVVAPEGWKLCLRDIDKNELYNLRDDPDERRNLFYKNAHGDVIAELTAQLHRWQEREGDKLKV